MALLDDVKTACRVKTDTFNDELTDLINEALADIGITDVKADLLTLKNEEDEPVELLPLVKMAVKTYCRMNFGEVEEGKYDRLKASYDEQKSQLLMSSTYSEVSAYV